MEAVNEAFVNFQLELVKKILDKQLQINQRYIVVKFYKIGFFYNKSDLEKYLVSLQPDYIYNNLSELAIHLINIDKIIDVSINVMN